jgi:VWFA-related protein
VLSDGKDFGSKTTQVQLTGLLEESDVLIYTIHYKTGAGAEELVVSQTGAVKVAEGKSSKPKTPKPPKKKGYSIMIPGQVDLPAQEEIERRERLISIEAVDTYKELSEITAGRFYVSDTPDLKKIFGTIADELRQHYWLGYKPKGGATAVELRAISVKVSRPEYVVRARGKFRAKQLNQ